MNVVQIVYEYQYQSIKIPMCMCCLTLTVQKILLSEAYVKQPDLQRDNDAGAGSGMVPDHVHGRRGNLASREYRSLGRNSCSKAANHASFHNSNYSSFTYPLIWKGHQLKYHLEARNVCRWNL